MACLYGGRGWARNGPNLTNLTCPTNERATIKLEFPSKVSRGEIYLHLRGRGLTG